MNETTDQLRPARMRNGVVAAILTISAISVTVVLLHGPAVRLALTGDSYQWIQHAHAATHQPTLLIADLDTFLRPSTTWTLAIDRAIWGGFDARGFRLSSLSLHALVALALAFAGRRLGLSFTAAAAIALVWVTSPFSDESAFVVAYRFQPLLLMSWLVLIAAWPRAGETWGRGRLIVVTITIGAAIAAKETWVVTPALVAALEIDRRSSLRQVFRSTFTVGLAVVAYVIVYFLSFPGSKSYFELGSHVLAKIPSQLAAFLYLKEPMPFSLGLSWQGLLALTVVAAMAVVCLRWRVAGTWTAVALFALPSLPTLLVPYMPQRYLAIPYAGFLLLTALWFTAAQERFPRWRLAMRGGALVVVAMVIVAGAAIVRSDLADYRRMAAAHEGLLVEAASFADVVFGGGPVLVVRDENEQPLLEILREPRGFAKLPYTRHADPYGLVDTAALFEWVIAEEGMRVEPVPAGIDGVVGSVLIHTVGGFIDAGRTVDLSAEADRWQTEDRRLRVIQAVSGSL